MKRHVILTALLIGAVPGLVPVQAAPTGGATSPDIDSGRLVAAQRMMDVAFTPARRKLLITDMIGAINKSSAAAVNETARMVESSSGDPRGKAIVTRYMERIKSETSAHFEHELPGLLDAMTRAYARRLSVGQLNELTSFFQTPVGQAYMEQSVTIWSDPDVARWQEASIAADMAGLPKLLDDMVAELSALPAAAKPRRP